MPFSRYFRFQVTRFVILFVERDGSTYLTSLLQSHPEILANYEKFAVIKDKGGTANEQLAWLNSFYIPPLFGRSGAIGFKTKLVDVLDMDRFTRLLREKQVKIIHMQRQNRIKAVVSRINARRLYEATGAWNLYQESDRRPPMTVDIQEFHSFVKEREEADQQLEEYVKEIRLPTLLVRYEDLQLDRDTVVRQALSFLNIPDRVLQAKPKKHTKDDLREVIVNFDELRASFLDTQYESMFDEVLAPSAS